MNDFEGTWIMRNGRQVEVIKYSGYIGKGADGSVYFFNESGDCVSQGPGFDLKEKLQLAEGCYPPRKVKEKI